ncbi:branched-chain amino acid aminotransferase [Staphylococcus pseudintermedius]|uniref:Branched-chain-amino-acid aminotransferase n=1 Tax=Staphylococcus pseudintermedius TaxID=283734 RepID=A0A166QXB9_STAPS|nr:branched-chain amino acid aminotransferase [Staphylococcus pseudintermedius]ADX77463.1 branched-chain amino acid aminotransferase [Staphylococcus pseudintermedius ED99]ANQ82783.1 branched-chain amino acid aminotransferase [Staphylococcus pseudintermedius]ANQ89225.1 branched-chain amino acid aminotransferase [Staphylococcus pseudintermedius]ANS90631.1 Branched-chain amino acid aminotransferase [Staphylococcus pseudintermedius]ASQ51443.1 branched-chain amino acid aminotransferase [Staphylococ
MSEKIELKVSQTLKEKPDLNQLTFGEVFTDYMLSFEYSTAEGWHDLKIIPYGPIELSPAAQSLHYGQAVFEGLKAYKHDGEVVLFRPEENFKRINQSLERLKMPQIDEALLLEGLKQLVDIDRDWVPSGEGQSLYIRPFVFATQGALGVHPSHEYRLLIILSPSGSYYGGDSLRPTKIYVEDEYVRAVRGGVGFAKVAGNYAASLLAQANANQLGFDQVLWLDGVEQKYVEEVGSMNIFFVIDGKVVTPSLNGSILPGITRKTVLELAASLGYETEERRISIDELYELHQSGALTEVFGTGTAAVISPVGTLQYREEEIVINNNETGPITQKLYDHYTGIQSGQLEDPHGWRVVVPHYER